MKSNQFQPFLSGISATDPTFSRDGKWVAYVTYPDRALWRSRSDGSERMQLTFPPMDVHFPSISPDGTKISFHTNEGKLFVISTDGGSPQAVSDNALFASWSPDGNDLSYETKNYEHHIVDVRTGKKSAVLFAPSGGLWIDQNTLVGPGPKETNFMTFNLKTQQSADLGPKNVGSIVNWMISPDGKYLYFTTGGAEPKAERIRFADQRVETITSLKDFHRVVNDDNTQIDVAPDGSPIFTRDTGYQEIYALKIRWP
jgi:Tol biopolymer transport system component